MFTTQLTSKSASRSAKLRVEGNEFYSQRKFFNAIVKYNESLCFAEHGSENLGLTYANRSAVYFEMKLYEKSLKNIEHARQNCYPKENFIVLEKREEKCRDFLKTQKEKSAFEPWKFFKLSYPPNKKLPFVAECLEVKINEKYGRHVITNAALNVGDIVVIEKPFCSILLSQSKLYNIPESNIFQRCSGCLKENSLDLIPCSSCCQAMFCSTECYQQAFNRYHNYECPVMDQLLTSPSIHMPLRQLFIALSVFNGSVEELENFFKDNENISTTVFDFDLSSHRHENDKNLLLAMRSLIKSKETFDLGEFEEILKNHDKLKDIWLSHQNFIRSFLQRQCQTSDLNVHGIFSGSSKKIESYDPNTVFSSLQHAIGKGTLLFGALTNHSCANNVFRVYVDGKVVYSVCRPIPKGSQLFDCYKTSFVKQKKSERQAKLLKEYGFKCDCEACINDYPTPPELNYKDFKIFKLANKLSDEILSSQPSQAMKKYRNCCELMQKNHRSFPCMELCLLQKSFATFLLIQTQPSTLFP